MGFVDLGDQNLVFDTSLTPSSAIEAKMIAEQLLGRQVNIIINSHYHNDHIWGNQVFSKDVQIVSSAKTKNLIDTKGREEISWYLENSSERLLDLSNQHAMELNEAVLAELSLWITYYQALAESVSQIQVRMPELTFERQLTFHGSQRTAEVITFQNGHTEDDAILYLPEDGIIFMVDLLFVRSHPFLLEANIDKAISILDELAELSANIYVPGHGPIGANSDIKILKEYIQTCQQLAQQYVDSGRPSSAITKIPVPDQFEHWQMGSIFHINLRHLVSLL